MKFSADEEARPQFLQMLLTTCRAEGFNHKAPRMDTNGSVPQYSYLMQTYRPSFLSPNAAHFFLRVQSRNRNE